MRECSVLDCGKRHEAKGFCNSHYRQWQRTGSPDKLPRRVTSDSERSRHIAKNGYVYFNKGGKKIAEHRSIMEEYLGRKLIPGENVHHVNGVRDDNRLDNLELWSTSQPKGQRVEDKTVWAIEWLKTYQPEALDSSLLAE